MRSGATEEAESLREILANLRGNAERTLERFEAAASDGIYAAVGDVSLTLQARMQKLTDAQDKEEKAKEEAKSLRQKLGVLGTRN